ncbi:MAG: hypothetical protein HQM03_15355 [Magnetococcales bacterium]|nr:hypothetical protein [Magnetococcales bacterium]
MTTVARKVEESRLDELASKGDILRLERDIEIVRKEIAAAKGDTIKWTAGMVAAQTALIIGAMFAVMRTNQPEPSPRFPVVQERRMPAPIQPEPHSSGQGVPVPAR